MMKPNPCASGDGTPITAATVDLDAETRERHAKDQLVLPLTPWTVQNVCYEVLKNFMLANPPSALGYPIQQVYTDDKNSEISLEIAYHFQDAVVQKRPGIYVGRGRVNTQFKTLNRNIQVNPKESESAMYAETTMPVNITVIGTNVGMTEQLAEYVFRIFMLHQTQIQKDFGLLKLQLAGIEPPSLKPESKDHISVTVELLAAFAMGSMVRGDHLKLKTFTMAVFTDCVSSALTLQ